MAAPPDITPPAPPAPPQRQRVTEWLHALRPAPVTADWRERLRVAAGAALGIGLSALICRWLAPGAAWPWLVAPLGASAVLVFGVPASPLAQPWAVVAGNTLSALVGIACLHLLPHPVLAAALAVGGAIVAMFALRCLHPPGGASALLVVLAGVQDPWFALRPVLIDSLLLVAAGMAYNAATGRAYPHAQRATPEPARGTARDDDARGIDADLDIVLARYNQVLDISRDDLKALLQDTGLQGYQRKLAHLRCSDIMSRQLITVRHDTPLQQAWGLFREHRIKALPVVDADRGIVGIVTPADFMRAAEVAGSDGFELRQRKLQDWATGQPAGGAGGATAAPLERVGQIMTRQVRVASVDRHLAELIPLFGSTGHHHIPIVDEAQRLVGIVTQTDLVRALAERAAPDSR